MTYTGLPIATQIFPPLPPETPNDTNQTQITPASAVTNDNGLPTIYLPNISPVNEEKEKECLTTSLDNEEHITDKHITVIEERPKKDPEGSSIDIEEI